jgi:hypothetical protein
MQTTYTPSLLRRHNRGEKLTKAEMRKLNRERKADFRKFKKQALIGFVCLAAYIITIGLMWPKQQF